MFNYGNSYHKELQWFPSKKRKFYFTNITLLVPNPNKIETKIKCKFSSFNNCLIYLTCSSQHISPLFSYLILSYSLPYRTNYLHPNKSPKMLILGLVCWLVCLFKSTQINKLTLGWQFLYQINSITKSHLHYQNCIRLSYIVP